VFGRVKPKILQNMRGKTLAWKQIRLLQALLHGFQEWFTFSCGEGLDGCSTRLVEGVEPRMKYLIFKPNVEDDSNADIIDESKLELWLKDGSIEDGDLIYELPNYPRRATREVKKIVLESSMESEKRMSEIVATKQQFIDAIFKLATEEDVSQRWNLSTMPWSSGFVFDALVKAGFVLLNKKALFGRLTSGNVKAEIANKLIKEILGDKPE